MHKFQEEDQALFEAIEAYRNGDGDKATVIYESTKKYTFQILHKEVERYKSQSMLTGDAISITEDVMQDLYLNFFNNIAKFRNEDPKSIFKWISVVAHRMLLDYVDKNKMEVLQFEKDDDFREENDIWDTSEINDSDMESHHELLPEAALEDKEFQQLILDFVQSLPEAQAQTVLLHFRGGMKYQEIADEMGVSLITVKTRMKKAKDSLEEIITKYEKKTGTKLHSVSILPLLWLLYRMSSENTTVPVAVDTVVTSSVAGASGVGIGGATTAGSIGTIGATTATKAISTRVLVAIVSTAVAIGGVAVGSQIVGKKQESNISTERDDLEDSGSDDNQQDNDKVDKDTSNKETDEGNSETNQNETAGDNNGSDTVTNNDGTGENSNGAESNTGAGENSNGTGGNTNNSGTGNASGNEDLGNSSGNEGTGGSEDSAGSGNSGNEDQGETTKANGTQENPYRIGDKITISNVTNVNSRDTSTYDIELTIMDYTVPKLENAVHVSFSNSEMILNIIKSKIKVTRDSSEAYGEVPLIFDLLSEDGKVYGQSGYLHKQDGNIITNISNNVEYDIGFHMTASSFNGESPYTYFRITYLNENRSYSYIYFKL